MLVVGRAINRLGAFSLPFLAVLLAQERRWSTMEVGLALSAFGAATIPSRLMGGRLAESLGRRTTIVLGLAGCAASQVALAVTATATATVVAVVALGLCFEIYEPPSQALIADEVAPADQPATYGLLAAALAAAGVLAGGLAIVLSRLDLRWLFVADAASCAGCALVLWLALPPDGPSHRTTTAARLDSSPWRDRRLMSLLALQSVFAVVYLQSTVALPLSLLARGLPPWSLGVLLTASAVTMVALQPALRWRRIRQTGRTSLLTAGYVLLAVGLSGYGVSTSLAAYLVSTVVLGAGDLLLMGHLMALVAALAPVNGRARYLAVFGMSWGFAAVAAPGAGSGLIASVGVSATWFVLAALCIGLAALVRTLPVRTA